MYEGNNPTSITLDDKYALKNSAKILGQIFSLVKGELTINATLSISNDADIIRPEIYNKKDVTIIDLSKCKIKANIGFIFKPLGGKVERIEVHKRHLFVVIDGLPDVYVPVLS